VAEKYGGSGFVCMDCVAPEHLKTAYQA
jgi:hypothetical protein